MNALPTKTLRTTNFTLRKLKVRLPLSNPINVDYGRLTFRMGHRLFFVSPARRVVDDKRGIILEGSIVVPQQPPTMLVFSFATMMSGLPYPFTSATATETASIPAALPPEL